MIRCLISVRSYFLWNWSFHRGFQPRRLGATGVENTTHLLFWKRIVKCGAKKENFIACGYNEVVINAFRSVIWFYLFQYYLCCRSMLRWVLARLRWFVPILISKKLIQWVNCLVILEANDYIRHAWRENNFFLIVRTLPNEMKMTPTYISRRRKRSNNWFVNRRSSLDISSIVEVISFLRNVNHF